MTTNRICVEISYEASPEELAMASTEQKANEFADTFERDVEGCLRGRFGYTGEISFDWTLDADG